MKLPERIKIGTQFWDVHERARKSDAALWEDSYGYTIDKDNQIVIDKDLPVSRKRTTLFHELLHAIRYTYAQVHPGKGTSFEDWEHYFIAHYDETVVTVLRENPDLVAYLLHDDA